MAFEKRYREERGLECAKTTENKNEFEQPQFENKTKHREKSLEI